jgi:acylphosphatase
MTQYFLTEDFMKVASRLLLLLIIVTAARAALAAEAKYDFDHQVDFSQYKTYSWAKVEMPSPLWNDRVKYAVDQALSGKGWTKVPTDGDVSIVAVGTTHEKQTLRTFYDGFDGWMWGGFGDAVTYADNYKVGTLIIDMFGTKTKKLIWRGQVTDTLAGDPEKNREKLDKAVKKLFEKFPPKAKRSSLDTFRDGEISTSNNLLTPDSLTNA